MSLEIRHLLSTPVYSIPNRLEILNSSGKIKLFKLLRSLSNALINPAAESFENVSPDELLIIVSVDNIRNKKDFIEMIIHLKIKYKL